MRDSPKASLAGQAWRVACWCRTGCDVELGEAVGVEGARVCGVSLATEYDGTADSHSGSKSRWCAAVQYTAMGICHCARGCCVGERVREKQDGAGLVPPRKELLEGVLKVSVPSTRFLLCKASGASLQIIQHQRHGQICITDSLQAYSTKQTGMQLTHLGTTRSSDRPHLSWPMAPRRKS